MSALKHYPIKSNFRLLKLQLPHPMENKIQFPCAVGSKIRAGIITQAIVFCQDSHTSHLGEVWQATLKGGLLGKMNCFLQTSMSYWSIVDWQCCVSFRSTAKWFSSVCDKWECQSLSRVRLFATPWTVADQAPQSIGYSGQESWSGLPFLSPGDLPNLGV